MAEGLVQESRRRLVFTMAVVTGVFLFYFTLFNTVWVEFRSTFGVVHAALAIGLSGGAAWYLRTPRPQPVVAAIGSLWIALHCLGMSLSQYTNLPDLTDPSPQVSWICVFLLLLPFVVPARPPAILGVALASACTDILAWAIAPYLDTHVVPNDSTALTSLFVPPFVCAVMAWGLSRVFVRLETEVAHARQLGAYRLDDRIGVGGMGEVWRASHRLLARPAAVKLIREGVVTERTRARFVREAHATAALQSPHSVELYDFGFADDGTAYYVMELLEGIDLQTLVSDHGPLPSERVAFFLRQACESLTEAHDRGLVHRDITPSNLFLCKRGPRVDFLKVLDFGLVKRHDLDDQDEGDTIEGTPGYLSPEAIRGDAIGPPTDLYALGCVAYFLLTGLRVFESDSLIGTLAAHLSDEAEPPSRKVDVHPALDEVVVRLLQKAPSERFANAEAVANALDAIPAWSQDDARGWWGQHLPELQ
ncbi:MAG: serine/threonine-protein kinase [Myxococcota bacterium]